VDKIKNKIPTLCFLTINKDLVDSTNKCNKFYRKLN
jgi:hypothetical protein